jgi:hypothetical protein
VLFAWLLVGIAYMFWLAFKKKASLLTIGALSGMVAFLVASVRVRIRFDFRRTACAFSFCLTVRFAGTIRFAGRRDTNPRLQVVPIFGIIVSVADDSVLSCTSKQHPTYDQRR